MGYANEKLTILVGRLSAFLDVGVISLAEQVTTLGEVVIEASQDAVAQTMEKKVYIVQVNLNQRGGSLLQVLQNLPGVTVQEGTVRLRGSDRVAVLIDGKQTALTGFGNQTSLDNLPASAIERIEIINNPQTSFADRVFQG